MNKVMSENNPSSKEEFILTGTIIGTDDKSKVIEKIRKNNSKQDELTKLALEEAIKVANNKQFGSTKELENFLNQELQNNIKKHDPINIMADMEEAEDDEDKIISPDMDADFQKLVQTRENNATAQYNNITRINNYINFAKTRSESLEKQMKSQKKILADLKTEQEKCKKTYQNFNQKLQKANQAFITAFQKCKTTSAILNNARTENNPTAITKAREQLKKDIVVAHKMKQQRDNLSTQLNAVRTAYAIATRTHNNILRKYNSNEYNKNLADKVVKKYSDVAKNLKQQRENILQQANKDAKDIISAIETQSGEPLTAERRSEIFQTHLFIETQKIYHYYLNLRQEYNTIQKNAKQANDIRRQQLSELQKIDKQIAENRQQIQQSITYERSLRTKIQQAKEELQKLQNNENPTYKQTYEEMLNEYKQLKAKYHTLTNQNQQLEEQRARISYDLYKQEPDIISQEKYLQSLLDAPTKEEKQPAEIRRRQAENNELHKNARNSLQTQYTYEAYIQNKRKTETLNSPKTKPQSRAQQQKQPQTQNIENKLPNNYFYSRNYLYSNYLKSMPLSSQSPNSAKQRNRNANNRYNIYNRYMLAYLKPNSAQPQIGLQQYNVYRMLRGQKHNLNINIKPQAKGTQQNYFHSYQSYISRITSKGTSNGWTRQF